MIHHERPLKMLSERSQSKKGDLLCDSIDIKCPELTNKWRQKMTDRSIDI